jgi:hypothetical protein
MCIEHQRAFAQVSSVWTVPKDKEVRLADGGDAANQNHVCLMIPFNHQQRGGRRDTDSSSQPEQSPESAMKKEVRITWRQCNTRDTVADDHGQAQREVHREAKISIINNLVRRPVSEIKLIRTDTTLDLSQKGREAEEKREKERKS